MQRLLVPGPRQQATYEQPKFKAEPVVLTIYCEDCIMEPPEELQEVVIDFNELRENNLDESFLAMFGGAVKMILKKMFDGGSGSSVSVRGRRGDVNAFTKVLGKEKRYMDSFLNLGLNDPKTYKSKYALNKAIRKFELKTKLKWPLK